MSAQQSDNKPLSDGPLCDVILSKIYRMWQKDTADKSRKSGCDSRRLRRQTRVVRDFLRNSRNKECRPIVARGCFHPQPLSPSLITDNRKWLYELSFATIGIHLCILRWLQKKNLKASSKLCVHRCEVEAKNVFWAQKIVQKTLFILLSQPICTNIELLLHYELRANEIAPEFIVRTPINRDIKESATKLTQPARRHYWTFNVIAYRNVAHEPYTHHVISPQYKITLILCLYSCISSLTSLFTKAFTRINLYQTRYFKAMEMV